MRLADLTAGTYVAVVPTPATLDLLRSWADQARVTLDEGLHVTLLYSHVAVRATPDPREHQVTTLGLAMLGEHLVLDLESASLSARHQHLLDLGGVHGHPTYRPHLTLVTGPPAGLIERLQPPPFRLGLWGEYIEPLRT